MKKLLSSVLVLCLCISTLVGCTPSNKELWDAYVKTSDVKSANADISITISIDASNVKDSNLKAALLLVNGTKLDLNSKTIKDGNAAAKVKLGGSVTAMQTPYNFDLWVDMNFTDSKNPKFVEVFKLPANIPNIPELFTSRFAYIDIVDTQKSVEGPKLNLDGYKDLMNSKQLLDSLKNIDTSNIKVVKKVVGSNKEFAFNLDGANAKSFTSKYFDAIFNGPIMKSMYKGETLEQSKEAFDTIGKVFEKINLFGKEGIKSVITVNSDGYFVEEKSSINLDIDVAQITNAFSEVSESKAVVAPNEKFSITINSVTKYSDINKVNTIDMPNLTNSNSIDFNSLSKMNSYSPNVLLNGKIVNFDVSPRTVNNRTMVPMRKIFETLGSTVNYDNGTITAVKGDKTIKHTIGENIVYVNGTPIVMDVASFEIEGRTLVPVRFISNALGATVDWNEKSNVVIITID